MRIELQSTLGRVGYFTLPDFQTPPDLVVWGQKAYKLKADARATPVLPAPGEKVILPGKPTAPDAVYVETDFIYIFPAGVKAEVML